MPRMGDAARQDDYELPDVGAPLVGDGGQVSAGAGWANRLFDRLPGAVMGGLAQMVETPGALMKANPYPPGTEQADAYEAFKKSTAAEWAPGMALNMMGGGVAGTGGGSRGTVVGSGPIRQAAALPMDEAARLARAREMGFDVDKPLYVSTLHPTEAFDPHGKFAGDKGISGISLTDNPAMANRYLERYGDFDYKGDPFAKGVAKVYIRPGEMRAFDAPLPSATPMGHPLPPNYAWPSSLEGVDTATFPDRITKRGTVAHVSDTSKPAIEGTEYILRDPSRVRSVFAKFDPANKDSGFLLGSGATDSRMGSVLGLSGMTINRGPPRGMLTAEEFTAPATPVPVGPERPNTFADPKLRAKAEKLWESYPQYAEAYPEVGPPALKAKLPDPKNPGKFLKVAGKEEVPYASMEEALAKDAEPGFFLEKKLLPEVAQFQKDRNTVQREMDLHGYTPYFDPAKRADVDPANYGPFPDTRVEAYPKKAQVQAKFDEMYGTPEARARLQAGYEKGKTIPDTDRWYFMKQLEDEYVKELGPAAGRDAFRKEFSGMMAATTGGASPYDNFLMSHYANYLNKKGQRVDQRAYEMNFPVGGRFASGNMDQAQKYIDRGMTPFSGAKNPKRSDFDNAYLGNRMSGTMDEQMFGAIMPGETIPKWYGPATRVLHEEAAKAGVDPRGFQDVAWAGLKSLGEEEAAAIAAAKRAKAKPGIGHNSEPFQFEYAGPMINTINRSIETTHRLTGMPVEEIVRRGLIRKEIPMYGLGALGLTGPMMGALADQSKYQTEEKM